MEKKSQARASSRGDIHQTRGGNRVIQRFEPGASTAMPSNVTYRLGKLRDLGLLKGEWLDCGCAYGGYTVAMVDLGVERAIGVDVVEERIVQAHERERDNAAVSFLHVSSDTLPFVEASFDGVLLNEVLEHVTDEIQTLREIHRVLRPGGHLVIMSPNRWFPFEGHGMRIGQYRVEVPVPLLPWLPSGISKHFMLARNYWPHELQDMICNEGFVIRTAGFVWPVFEAFPWLPHPVIHRYRNLIPELERIPFIRCFGVSIFIVAQK
jgi:2-polyprenyl-3-methyl-5-hydroxy-6-metoxy-1,4-benzoquinol methylase